MPAAAQRLLEANELVELILLELDHRTLLCWAQRVSRQWRDIILSSPKIRVKLFLRPAFVPDNLHGGIRPVQNPQMWKRSWRLQDLFQVNEGDIDRAYNARRTGKPFPDSVPALPSSSTAPYAFIGPWKSYHTRTSFTCEGVSWRRMLIQQPAITSFGQVIVRRRLDGSISTRVGTAACPEGVTMGHVWDALRQSMSLLKTDMCLMRLVWWEPTITSFEKALYPMAEDIQNLFQQGAQLVLAIGFSECHPSDKFYGKFADEYNTLCHCEEYDPLDFNLQETITQADH